ncbi:hypothetical protein BTUL_0151g00020 [Botrytis tulipae]|uniref:Uncharacterized protein n=1 Tax=Botrytis tulipae TaxID=87230 RepID=A0A4Z1EKQ7_9HELO|nr:hypothetical protein BTUL_0151g00020 [Botrytis tulipae]
MEAVAGTLTCFKNGDKVATSNDLICLCDGLNCSVDESSKFVVSLNCEEGEAGKFSCVFGDRFSGVDSFSDKKERDGIPKITNQNTTSQASLETRRGFSFIGGLPEFFTGGSDKCDKFFEKRDLGSATSCSQYTDQRSSTHSYTTFATVMLASVSTKIPTAHLLGPMKWKR